MRIGDRCCVSGRRGTIRYVGSVDGQKGNWVGIEWDENDSGKHDGMVNGKRYFTARHPKGGSFVREALVNLGKDLVEEITERYIRSTECDSEHISTKEIEYVGLNKTIEKQGNIHLLHFIVLDSRLVSRPPPVSSKPFLFCKELNLYNNLLHRWEDVLDILTFFPRLRELVLRRNRMDNIDDLVVCEPSSKCPSTLTDLILSDCQVSSTTISNALTWLSSVTLLYALRNELPYFHPTQNVASRLVVLDLEENPLKSFRNIKGNFNSLNHLSLRRCALERIDLSESNCNFPSLQTLNLRDNAIQDWASINELQCLSTLTCLHIDTKSFHAEHGIAVFEVMIAKLPSVGDLNKFIISEVERRSAEVRFINKYASLSAEKAADHKHDIDRLVKVHGPPAVDKSVHGLSVIRIKIAFGEKQIEKSIPLNLTILRLNEMLRRLFRVRGETSLQLVKEGLEHQIVELDNPMRPFDHYSPEATDSLRLVVLD